MLIPMVPTRVLGSMSQPADSIVEDLAAEAYLRLSKSFSAFYDGPDVS
jgi:hypothetical protein